MTGTVALDIETVSPNLGDGETVDFMDSRDFQLVAVGVGHRLTPDSDVEIDVLWRSGIEDGDEYELLCELVYWLTERHADELITYNGVNFDLRHIRGRAQILADEVGDESLPEAVHVALQRPSYHRDLMHDVISQHGHRMSLEDAVEEHTGDRPPAFSWNGETIGNGDIPRLAQKWLTHRSGLADLGDRAPQLRNTLENYIRADIEPLFRLHDNLDR